MKTLKLLLTALALCGAALVARATTRTVTSLADSGAGTLRQAISDSATGDTIIFAVTGTIRLTSGELVIGRNLTIAGPGAKSLFVLANAQSRLFNIASGTVNISGLTISDGAADSGGAIFNQGTLVLSQCVVSISAANGNSGTTGTGGGIFNQGTLVLKDCTLSDNSAVQSGGGIWSYLGHLALTNCTLTGNSAAWSDCNYPAGGAIDSKGSGQIGTLVLTACTISGNSGNAGGLLAEGPCTICNTIIAGNYQTCQMLGDVVCWNNGSIISGGYNLIGNINGSSGWVASDLTGTAATPLQLGPLQNNGGPTPTMAPQAGSVAIDNGNSFGLTSDQRGLPRPVVLPGYPVQAGGDGSDIGAVELQSVTADIGLRAYDGTSIIKLSGEVGNISSPLRISKNGTTYGILLVATNDGSASKIRIPTSSGVKAVQRLP